jgi:hypothetical protein
MVNRSREYWFYSHQSLDKGMKNKMTLHGLAVKEFFRMPSVCLTYFQHDHKIVKLTYLNNHNFFQSKNFL